jgi:hypothetical protein
MARVGMLMQRRRASEADDVSHVSAVVDEYVDEIMTCLMYPWEFITRLVIVVRVLVGVRVFCGR